MTNTQLVLHQKFLEMQMRNPRFTLRAYARRVGMSSGALSELLSGKRKMTAKSARRIGEALGLDPSEILQLSSSSAQESSKLEYQRLADDQFHLISDWWHYAILNLLKTKGFRSDVSWVAVRLGLSESTTDRAVSRLMRLGLLKKSARGKWTRTPDRLQTSDEILNLSVRKSHLQDLELARTSLETDPIETRDLTSMTFAVDAAQLPAAKASIRQFQDEFVARFETGQPTEVYRLSVQLFPLSKKGSSP